MSAYKFWPFKSNSNIPPLPKAGEVVLYADANGVMKVRKSDGTSASVASAGEIIVLANISDMTAAARTFNAAADAAAQAALLPVLPLDGSKAMTGNLTLAGYTEGPVVIGTVTTAHTLAITAGTFLTATLTASTECTFTMPAAAAGKSFTLLLKQAAATGLGTAVFTGVKWDIAGAPVVTATAGKMDIFSFSSDGTNWYGSVSQGYTP